MIKETSDCVDVPNAACVYLAAHEEGEGLCEVTLFGGNGCQDANRIGGWQFGNDGDGTNQNFGSFWAVCAD